LNALIDAFQVVTLIKPAPTPQDLDTGEQDTLRILDDAGMWAANKPPAMSDADWVKTQAPYKDFAKKNLMAIYLARKNDKRAVDDLRKLITRDPQMGTATYQLALAMQRIIIAEKTPEKEPAMFWEFARAIDLTGPNGIPQDVRTGATKFLTDSYTLFHGSTAGLQELLTQAKDSPFPPDNFSIKSTVDIAKEDAAKDQAEHDKDPITYLWVHYVKAPLQQDGGDAYFESTVKGAGLPPPSDSGMPQFFKGKIVSISPDPKPKEVRVAMTTPGVVDAILTFDKALEGKMDPGEEIQFTGAAVSWTKEPFTVTFDVDPKEGLNGTWTGKNPPAGRGGAGGAKGTGKAAPGAPKGTPKQ
jgi:hypothetical protein